jgi:hypothetical protein
MAHPDESPDQLNPGRSPDTAADERQAELDLGGEEDRSFDPSHVEANLTREQGNGVGQRELNRQWDPTRADSTEHFGQMGPKEDMERSDIEHSSGGGGSGVEQA